MPFTIYLDPRPTKKGTCRIMCQYTKGKEPRFRFKSGYSIDCKLWSKIKRRVKTGRDPYLISINRELELMESQANNIINDIEIVHKKYASVAAFKDAWESRNKDSEFWHSFDKYVQAKKSEDLSKGSIHNINQLRFRIQEMEAKQGRILFSDMDQEFLDSFIAHCKNTKSTKTGEPYSLYTINTYISNLNSFLTYAYKREWHNQEKFKRWTKPKSIKNRPKPKKNLSLEELLRIEWVRLSERHEAVRDTFVFLCFSGLRFGEYESITQKNRKGSVLEYTRKKQWYDDDRALNVIGFNKEMKAFFDKYPVLPKLSLRGFNGILKEVATLAGVDKDISSSWARHTFVSLGSEMGVNIQEISDTAGHSSVSMTKTYDKSRPIRLGAEKLSNKIAAKREAFIRKLG